MSEFLWRLRMTHRMGWTAFFREFPPSILAFTTLPRVLMQVAFFVLVAGVAGGASAEEFVTIGAIATTMCVFTVTSVCEVTILEADSGTFGRHLRSDLNPLTAYSVRAVPHVLGAAAIALVSILVIPVATGHAGLTDDLLRAFPLYVLMAVSCSAAGLAIGVMSSPSDNYILASNVLGYLILIGSGAIIPADRLAYFGDVTSILPMRHGINATRALLADRPWVLEAGIELAVGGFWALVAWLAVIYQIRRVRVHGIGA